MQVKWWITALIFLVGVGVGCGITRAWDREDAVLPAAVTETQPHSVQQPTQPDAQQSGVTQKPADFPFALEYTSLVAQKLISYEGAYLEDGSEEAVEDVAALVLENTGTIGIEYAQIILLQNGRELSFDATYIPPRSTVLLLEETRQPYSDAPVTDCRCRTVIPGVFDRAERTVAVKETGMCTLEVTNLTDQTFRGVRIYYKHHEGANDLYVGGITYSTVIPNLEPGETRSVTPYRYASGYAQVVAVVPE
ncbi:MAG: hypothetical protein IJE24_00215 [Oscillospiraceae bacterium]|nr:hypothetical protein [Oscillospiraceae bacterium]